MSRPRKEPLPDWEGPKLCFSCLQVLGKRKDRIMVHGLDRQLMMMFCRECAVLILGRLKVLLREP